MCPSLETNSIHPARPNSIKVFSSVCTCLAAARSPASEITYTDSRQMIFDSPEDTPISESERQAVEENARMRLRVCRRRALYATGAFLLNCAAIYPFLKGHPLDAYWESVGKYLVFLALALMLVSLHRILLLWGAWCLLRHPETELI